MATMTVIAVCGDQKLGVLPKKHLTPGKQYWHPRYPVHLTDVKSGRSDPSQVASLQPFIAGLAIIMEGINGCAYSFGGLAVIHWYYFLATDNPRMSETAMSWK